MSTFFDNFYSQYQNQMNSYNPDQAAASQGFNQNPDGSYTTMPQGFNSSTTTVLPGHFDQNQSNQGRAQMGAALFGDMQKQQQATDQNFAQGQAAIGNFSQEVDNQAQASLDQGMAGGQNLKDQGMDFFQFGQDFLAEQTAKVDQLNSDLDLQQGEVMSASALGAQKKAESNMAQLEAQAATGDPMAKQSLVQAKHDYGMSTQQNLSMLGSQMNAQSHQMKMGGIQSINQSAGVATSFANLGASMFTQGQTMQNAAQQYSSNLKVQGRQTEAQMQMAFQYSPVAEAPVFMAMMGFDMNPFTEGYEGMPETYMNQL